MKEKDRELLEEETDPEEYQDDFDSWEKLRNYDPQKTLTKVLIVLLIVALIILGVELAIIYL
ncbi:MAG: hypothetical protein K6A70_07730 [Erysipelotrichaceae bacterium]|nr:hypothetical protein [Erysipelotrichaceae bacterium]